MGPTLGHVVGYGYPSPVLARSPPVLARSPPKGSPSLEFVRPILRHGRVFPLASRHANFLINALACSGRISFTPMFHFKKYCCRDPTNAARDRTYSSTRRTTKPPHPPDRCTDESPTWTSTVTPCDSFQDNGGCISFGLEPTHSSRPPPYLNKHAAHREYHAWPFELVHGPPITVTGVVRGSSILSLRLVNL